MNILAAEAHGQQRYRLVGSALTVDLGRADQKSVRVGLRPEACRLKVVDADDDPHGRVKVVQSLGNATDVGVDLAQVLFTIGVPGFDASGGRYACAHRLEQRDAARVRHRHRSPVTDAS